MHLRAALWFQHGKWRWKQFRYRQLSTPNTSKQQRKIVQQWAWNAPPLHHHRYHIHISSMTPNATIMDPSVHLSMHSVMINFSSRQFSVQTTKPYQSMKILFLLLFLHLTIQDSFSSEQTTLSTCLQYLMQLTSRDRWWKRTRVHVHTFPGHIHSSFSLSKGLLPLVNTLIPQSSASYSF